MSDAALSRSFYGADVDESPPEPLAECEEDDGDEGPLAPHLAPRAAAALAAVRRDLVGVGAPFRTPLGVKRLCYADWAATGRALRQVEAQVRSRVLPFHGNTHVTSSLVGDQSSCYLSEARQAVAQAVNARVQYSSSASGGDALFFCGTGATACANKLLTLLRLHLPLPPGTPPAQRPVVLVSEKEHHSNLLPWRESCATVVTVPDAPCGTKLCLSALQAALRATAGDGGSRRLRLACFSAASNVTGCCEDVQGVTALLHSHGCLAVWDYAGASTGLTVDCNPVPRPPLAGGLLCARDVALDAAFLSAHKLPGGPACPGVLLLKRRLLSARHPPASPGGGTVFFVTARSHSYVSDSEEREQGGTRDVIGACRTALTLRARALTAFLCWASQTPTAPPLNKRCAPRPATERRCDLDTAGSPSLGAHLTTRSHSRSPRCMQSLTTAGASFPRIAWIQPRASGSTKAERRAIRSGNGLPKQTRLRVLFQMRRTLTCISCALTGRRACLTLRACLRTPRPAAKPRHTTRWQRTRRCAGSRSLQKRPRCCWRNSAPAAAPSVPAPWAL